MDKYELVFLCAIFALVTLILYCSINYKKSEAEAKPVTTEIPEYIMKCTTYSGTCTEYTIYRITRN